MNRRGEKPATLEVETVKKEPEKPVDLLANADISRFDRSKRNKRPDRNSGRGERRGHNGEAMRTRSQENHREKGNRRNRDRGGRKCTVAISSKRRLN